MASENCSLEDIYGKNSETMAQIYPGLLSGTLTSSTTLYLHQVADSSCGTPPLACLAVHVDTLVPELALLDDLQTLGDGAKRGRAEVNGVEVPLPDTMSSPFLWSWHVAQLSSSKCN